MLERSATEIGHRLTGDDWLPATRLVLTVLLEDLPELYELRRKLAGIKEFWRTSTAMVLDLTQTYEFQGATIRYEPIPGRPGVLNLVVATRDAHGVLRTLDEVEKLIRALISEAFAADPFLEKLADLPEVVARLRAAQRLSDLGRPEGEQISAAVTAELRAVLGEIRELNRKHTREVRADRSIAFGLATFEGNAASPVGADLRGVHASADAWLRQQFQRTAQPAGDEPSYVDEGIYLDGLRALATHELAKGNFMHWVNMVGLPLLAVFFPVVAGGIGLVQAGLGARTAHEHVELQRGMLGGDEILSRADVEMESAAAGIGLGLGLLPLVGRLSSATRAAGALARGETTAARLAREALLEFTSRLGALTVPQLTAMFLQELVTANVLGLAVSEAVGAVARSVAEQYRYQAGGSLDPDAMRALVEQALTEAAELTEEAP